MWGSVLSPYVGPRDPTQVAGCGGRSPYAEPRQEVWNVPFEKSTHVHSCGLLWQMWLLKCICVAVLLGGISFSCLFLSSVSEALLRSREASHAPLPPALRAEDFLTSPGQSSG